MISCLTSWLKILFVFKFLVARKNITHTLLTQPFSHAFLTHFIWLKLIKWYNKSKLYSKNEFERKKWWWHCWSEPLWGDLWEWNCTICTSNQLSKNVFSNYIHSNPQPTPPYVNRYDRANVRAVCYKMMINKSKFIRNSKTFLSCTQILATLASNRIL